MGADRASFHLACSTACTAGKSSRRKKNTGALIQVGSGNAVQAGALPGLTGAVIQNTLNGQQIQAITTLNTTVNSLGAFTATNFLSTLNNALTGVARPR